ncbi:hypothetical protein KM043_004570 [Ampulex compressa]|nr:hypothetical protein KM043_004570 [Ampulex compressa]
MSSNIRILDNFNVLTLQTRGILSYSPNGEYLMFARDAYVTVCTPGTHGSPPDLPKSVIDSGHLQGNVRVMLASSRIGLAWHSTLKTVLGRRCVVQRRRVEKG